MVFYFFQCTSPIKVSSIDLMRAECHDRLSIANGCSRDVVSSDVSSIQKKRRELSILIDTKLPQAPMPKMLFPPCVVVDFFFDEEERRYAITRRQRKEHKKGEKLARASQNSPYSNPLCPFFPGSFHLFIFCQREERYKNARFVSRINKKESKR